MPIPKSVKRFYMQNTYDFAGVSGPEGMVLHIIQYYYGKDALPAVRIVYFLETTLCLLNNYTNRLDAVRHALQKMFLDIGSYVRSWSFHNGSSPVVYNETLSLVNSGLYTKNSLLTPILHMYRDREEGCDRFGLFLTPVEEAPGIEFLEFSDNGQKETKAFSPDQFSDQFDMHLLYVDVPVKPISFVKVMGILLKQIIARVQKSGEIGRERLSEILRQKEAGLEAEFGAGIKKQIMRKRRESGLNPGFADRLFSALLQEQDETPDYAKLMIDIYSLLFFLSDNGENENGGRAHAN